MTSKHRYLNIAVAVLGLMVGFATPSYAVQVRMLSWASADGDLQFDANHKATRLRLFTDSFSTAMELKGDGPVVLYKVVDHEGKPRKQVACTIAIPAGMKRGLLLLIPGDDTLAVDRKVLPDESGFVSQGAPLIYDYIWFDDSPEARPSGTIEFRNLSRLPIALQIDQSQLMLAPQAKAQVPLTPGAKRMPFRAAAQINGQWKIFRSNPLSTRSPDRMLVILRDAAMSHDEAVSDGEPNIAMISLFDWPAPPTPETGPMLSANSK